MLSSINLLDWPRNVIANWAGFEESNNAQTWLSSSIWNSQPICSLTPNPKLGCEYGRPLFVLDGIQDKKRPMLVWARLLNNMKKNYGLSSPWSLYCYKSQLSYTALPIWPTWPPQGWLGVGSPEMGIKIYQKGNRVVGRLPLPQTSSANNLRQLDWRGHRRGNFMEVISASVSARQHGEPP